MPQACSAPTSIPRRGSPTRQVWTPEVAFGILQTFVETGVKCEAGGVYDQILRNDMRVRLDPVEDGDRDRLLTVTAVWREHEPFTALQVVWPDTNGKLPGEEGVEEQYAEVQQLSGV